MSSRRPTPKSRIPLLALPSQTEQQAENADPGGNRAGNRVDAHVRVHSSRSQDEQHSDQGRTSAYCRLRTLARAPEPEQHLHDDGGDAVDVRIRLEWDEESRRRSWIKRKRPTRPMSTVLDASSARWLARCAAGARGRFGIRRRWNCDRVLMGSCISYWKMDSDPGFQQTCREVGSNGRIEL